MPVVTHGPRLLFLLAEEVFHLASFHLASFQWMHSNEGSTRWTDVDFWN